MPAERSIPRAARLVPSEKIAAKITSRIAYVDRVSILLRRPIRQDDLRQLNKHNANPRGKRVSLLNRPGPQIVDLPQPTMAALEFLAARRRDHVVSYIELALDLIVDDQQDLDALAHFLDRHLVQTWHRGKIVVQGATRYWRPRASARNLVVYPDRHSKITGEVHCLHVEMRLLGAEAVRRAGIGAIADITNFDHRAFWRRHLRLVDIDREKLSLAVRRTRCRKSAPADRAGIRLRTAADYFAAAASRQDRPIGAAQDVIDHARAMKLDIRRAIVRIDPAPFLPG